MYCLNSEFSFTQIGYLIKSIELNIFYNIPIVKRRTYEFMTFLITFMWKETQTGLAKILSWITDSISYNSYRCA